MAECVCVSLARRAPGQPVFSGPTGAPLRVPGLGMVYKHWGMHSAIKADTLVFGFGCRPAAAAAAAAAAGAGAGAAAGAGNPKTVFATFTQYRKMCSTAVCDHAHKHAGKYMAAVCAVEVLATQLAAGSRHARRTAKEHDDQGSSQRTADLAQRALGEMFDEVRASYVRAKERETAAAASASASASPSSSVATCRGHGVRPHEEDEEEDEGKGEEEEEEAAAAAATAGAQRRYDADGNELCNNDDDDEDNDDDGEDAECIEEDAERAGCDDNGDNDDDDYDDDASSDDDGGGGGGGGGRLPHVDVDLDVDVDGWTACPHPTPVWVLTHL